jgi:hypothetical protein
MMCRPTTASRRRREPSQALRHMVHGRRGSSKRSTDLATPTKGQSIGDESAV